jgi:hypothetical protein
MADTLGRHQGLSRRAFFQSAAGMAAGFVALNDTFGTVFEASRAEAATPAMAQERAGALKDQFIMDMHTHFLRDDTRLTNFVRSREAVGKAGWNPALVDKPQTLDDLKFNNYFKEVYLDSDTKIALISSSPSEIPRDWFLTNEMMIEARDKVNKEAGSRRMFAHAIFTPGWDGWLEHLEESLKIEALRRLEIPEDMQKKYGFKPVGPADGPIKTAIFGGTNARLYNYDVSKRTDIGPNRDRFAHMKEQYEKNGPARSNLRYGYVSGPVDWSAFA